MPKLNPIQEIALDVVDFLYFYDVASLTSFDLKGENKAVYEQLNSLIDNIIKDRNLAGENAARYKHFLLCGVEIFATYNLDREVTSYYPLNKGDRWQFVRSLHENAVELLQQEIKKNGFSIENYQQDCRDILQETNIEKKPNSVCYGLVAKALSFDYEGCISAHIYRVFLDIQILATARDSKDDNFVYNKPEHIFLRAILFVEFEIMRNKLFHKNDRPNLIIQYDDKKMSERRKKKEEAYVFKTIRFIRSAIDTELSNIINYDLNSKEDVNSYLSDLGDHLCYNKMFSDYNSRWVSLFGLWYLTYLEILNPKATKFYELNNDRRLTDQASKELKKQYGLSIEPKRIYLYIKKYEGYLKFIRQGLHELMNAPKQGFVTPCLDYYFYYHPHLSEKLLDLYDSFDEKK